ncbi:MAG: inositol monophosphatase [Solirubrobacteraceae bacterium MAG38_C4-C5]|nr:inositol monophosphatase [Candidatus Siliceabacter maunaloa]
MSSSPSELCVVAADAARAAGALLLQRFVAQGGEEVRTKSTPTDPVSEADLAAERAIREVLQARRPGDAILGEEGGESLGEETPGSPSLRWIVDPLDGTVNYLYGIGQWCVSVAVHDDDGALAGVVFDPLRDELFAAERDGEPTLNGRPLVRPVRDELATALVATGFGYDAAERAHQAVVVAALLPWVRDVRRLGSAALDLAWTAAGRVDAYYERGGKPWDVAAGSLLCERAGLAVRRIEPCGDHEPLGLLAAPAALADALEPFVV